MTIAILMLVSSLTFTGVHGIESVVAMVLMNGSSKVDRDDLSSVVYLKTLISGLPPLNAIQFDDDGRLLISTDFPGIVGSVFRIDLIGDVQFEILLDISKSNGGRHFRAAGMNFYEGAWLVDSQGDGEVKRYAYEHRLTDMHGNVIREVLA